MLLPNHMPTRISIFAPYIAIGCLIRSQGPADGQSYEDWKAAYDEWVSAGRDYFDFSAYGNAGIQWAKTSFVQPQVSLTLM